MGNAESVPEPGVFRVVHPVDKRVPLLGEKSGANPSSVEPIHLIVREKLFSWSGDSFKIKTYRGDVYGNGLHVKGKAFAFRDQMVLEDASGHAIAVCLRKFEVIGQTFKIYTTRPFSIGQEPSERRYNQQPLYTFAEVKRVPFTIEQHVFLHNDQAASFVIRRVGYLPKKRLVTRRGVPAALIEGGTWDNNWSSYLLTINPGIDPCLIICLTAICDEMDEDR